MSTLKMMATKSKNLLLDAVDNLLGKDLALVEVVAPRATMCLRAMPSTGFALDSTRSMKVATFRSQMRAPRQAHDDAAAVDRRRLLHQRDQRGDVADNVEAHRAPHGVGELAEDQGRPNGLDARRCHSVLMSADTFVKAARGLRMRELQMATPTPASPRFPSL